MNQQEYDALSPAEQQAHDAKERQREADEQASLPYKWTQDLDHVAVTYEIEGGTRAKNLDVSIKRSSLKVVRKDTKETLLEGEFPREVKLDDSTWSLEDGKILSIHLEKAAASTWWPHVFTRDPKIDTTKLVPENSKLSDLDGETRAMVEKMMVSSQVAQRWWGAGEKDKGADKSRTRQQFDNQQKQMGKPSSDELKQQEVRHV